MDILSILTTIFGIAMSFGYYPQAYKIFKRKSVKDISLFTFSIFFIGIVVWLIYGLNKIDWPIIISNATALIGCGLVLGLYLVYKK